jgi:hypothetical protein
LPSSVTTRKRAPAPEPPTTPERTRMLASIPIVHEPHCLLADVRQELSARPVLADYPRRLAVLLKADEHDVVTILEALKVEGGVLA